MCTDTGYSIHYGKNYTIVSQIAKIAKYNIHVLLLSDTGNINVTIGMNNSCVRHQQFLNFFSPSQSDLAIEKSLHF